MDTPQAVVEQGPPLPSLERIEDLPSPGAPCWLGFSFQGLQCYVSIVWRAGEHFAWHSVAVNPDSALHVLAGYVGVFNVREFAFDPWVGAWLAGEFGLRFPAVATVAVRPNRQLRHELDCAIAAGRIASVPVEHAGQFALARALSSRIDLQRCKWPGCELPALCSSGNSGGKLVCSEHFKVTNGEPARRDDDPEFLVCRQPGRIGIETAFRLRHQINDLTERAYGRRIPHLLLEEGGSLEVVRSGGWIYAYEAPNPPIGEYEVACVFPAGEPDAHIALAVRTKSRWRFDNENLKGVEVYAYRPAPAPPPVRRSATALYREVVEKDFLTEVQARQREEGSA